MSDTLWAAYLARGVPGASSPLLLPVAGSHPSACVPDQSRVEQVLRYVEELFRQDGASSFSSKMAVGFLQMKLAANPEKMARVVAYLLGRLNGKQRWVTHPLQSGCPNILPGLRAQPFWDTSSFPWVAQLEAAFPLILQEFLDLRAKGPHFQPYRAPVSEEKSKATVSTSNINTNMQSDVASTDAGTSKDLFLSSSTNSNAVDGLGQLATDRGDWNVCYLYLHDMECFDHNREACPETIRAIKSIPHQYNHALFSALAPDTHVSAHYGPTNKKLRCHLPLVVPTRPPAHTETQEEEPPLCSLTVANEERGLEAGKCVIFDDSFLHEAVNRAGEFNTSDPSSGPRVVLIIDVWHPDLSAEEIKFLGFLEKAKMKAVRKFANDDKTKTATAVSESGAEGCIDSNSNNNRTCVDSKSKEDYKPPNTFFNVIESAHGTDVKKTNIWTS